MKYEVSESEYDIVAFRIKYGDLYEPNYQINTNYNVTDEPDWIDVDEATYNRHNHPYRRIVYRLKDQPKEETPVKESVGQTPTTREIRAVESVEQVAEGYILAEGFTDEREQWHLREAIKFGAQWQLQNLPIDEILELVAESAEASNEVRGNLLSPKVSKQSILNCKPEILKLLNQK